MGSYARGARRRGGDVDLVALAAGPVPPPPWGAPVGPPESYGALTSRRYDAAGLEVELGVTTPDWPGGEAVAARALRVLHDRDGRLVALRPPPPPPVPLAPARALSDGVVVLRAPRAGDLPAWAGFAADEEVLRWTPVPPGLTAEDLSWALDPAAGHLVIADADDDRFLGACDARTGDGGAELGYALLEGARGRGFATRAIALLTAWLLGEGAARVNAYVDPRNPRSARVLERAGYAREGFLRGWRGPGADRDAWSALR